MNKAERITSFKNLSSRISQLSNTELESHLCSETPVHVGMGGTSYKMMIDNFPVFVKKIPLTDLERLPCNIRSTANLFKLPMCFQYGVGSKGFSAWRELEAHLITTGWVLSGQCPNFPMLYNWRIFDTEKPLPMNDEQRSSFERDIIYWENSAAIQQRYEAIHNASAHLVLFSEYIPQTLHDWMNTIIKNTEKCDQASFAIVNAVQQIQSTVQFMKTQEFIHFDAHLENIATDGQGLYFTDFGLSLSEHFDFSPDEHIFFQNHYSYDECSTSINILHSLTKNMFGPAYNGRNDFKDKLSRDP
ncbi:MAG: protein kinase family protein [Pseudomonadota bacterium]